MGRSHAIREAARGVRAHTALHWDVLNASVHGDAAVFYPLCDLCFRC